MNKTHVIEKINGNLMEVRLRGKLTSEDYRDFVPDTERMIQEHGKIRILVELDDFQGWDAGALWKDIQWDVKHARDIERIAVVGEKKWHEWMASFCKPFTSATVRYFDHDRMDEARVWIGASA